MREDEGEKEESVGGDGVKEGNEGWGKISPGLEEEQ